MYARNAEERNVSVVPVLPDSGSVQPARDAAPADVPAPRSSALSAFARVFARPFSMTCSHFSDL